jgi:hypothetical protein
MRRGLTSVTGPSGCRPAFGVTSVTGPSGCRPAFGVTSVTGPSGCRPAFGVTSVLALAGGALPIAWMAACGTIEPVEVEDVSDGAADRTVTVTSNLDGSTPPSDGGAPGDGAVLDATIVVSRMWKSLAGSELATTEAGTQITGYSGLNHPMIVPSPEPVIPSDDYTVTATVRAGSHCEFGVVGRLQEDGGGAIVSASTWGLEPFPSIGVMDSTHNPSNAADGPGYDASTFGGRRYQVKLRVSGARFEGKFWRTSNPEPEAWFGPSPTLLETGRRVGFYVYFCYDAVLESMTITVP